MPLPPEKLIDKGLAINRVSSSNINWFAYNEKTKDLFVLFNSGGLYVYHDVPMDIYKGFLRAGSKGKYHNVKIKYQFNYERLN